MKINKEAQNVTTVHKKKEGTIHKKMDMSISSNAISTRTKDVAKGGVRSGANLARRKISENVEGGENLEQTYEVTKLAAKPAGEVIWQGNQVRKKRKAKNTLKKTQGRTIRKKASYRGRQHAIKSAEKTAKKTGKKVAKKTTKETTKETAKVAAKAGTKVATTVGTTVAGTAVGPEGTLAGIAAEIGAGVKVETTFYKAQQRMRMFKYFKDKMQTADKQNDNLLKLAASMMVNHFVYMARVLATILAPFVVPILIVVIAVGGLVFAIIAILYNSPLALFLPPLSTGDNIHSVTTQYVTEFNQDINSLVDKHDGADKGRKLYVDYEGMSQTPSNYYDIMCVYMVKYGFENTAAEMNDTNKENLKTVFDDMCSYKTDKSSEEEGRGDNKQTVKYLNVKVTLKTYTQMADSYSFSDDQKDLLSKMMKQYIANGSVSGGTPMSNLKGSLSEKEVKDITDKISDPIRKQVVEFALSKVGYPYSQPNRDSGIAFDCSSLAFYSWKAAGINIAFGGLTTAAGEAEGLKDKQIKEENLRPGDLIFYSYTSNGRYKNISHVGIYVGSGKMVEAVDEAHGVCIGDYHNESMVMICRPNK